MQSFCRSARLRPHVTRTGKAGAGHLGRANLTHTSVRPLWSRFNDLILGGHGTGEMFVSGWWRKYSFASPSQVCALTIATYMAYVACRTEREAGAELDFEKNSWKRTSRPKPPIPRYYTFQQRDPTTVGESTYI